MKRKFIILILVMATVIYASIFFTSAASYREFQNTLGRHDTLITTNDPARYAKLSIEGSTLKVEGRYVDEYPTEVYFSNARMSSYRQDFKFLGDGKFTATLSGKMLGEHALVTIAFQSGQRMSYRIENDSGMWFFGDNHNEANTSAMLGSYKICDSETAAIYVDKDMDFQQSEQTLQAISDLAMEITNGISGDYAKARALSNWVADNLYYDSDSADAVVSLETIELGNVLETRKTVCAGFANFYCALLESIGISAVNLKGGVVYPNKCTYEELGKITVVHEWVAFWLEEESRWVYADPCWDCGNTVEGGEYINRTLPRRYFDITGLAFSQDHRADAAEKREFYPTIAYLSELYAIESDATTTQPPQTDPTEQSTTETTVQTISSSELAALDALEREEGDLLPTVQVDNNMTLVYTVVTAMVIGIIIMIVVIIINRRKNK